MRHEPAAPRSRVKHSTTEPLRSYLQFNGGGQLYILRKPVIFMVPEGTNISRGPKLFQGVKLLFLWTLIELVIFRGRDLPGSAHAILE